MPVNTMNSQQTRQYQQPNLEVLRRSYRAILSELTFNSKPIITNLTIMAQENQGAATIIVKEIENQLRINAVGQKLPIIYLIDSICKNVGGIYISVFGRNMVDTFLGAYNLSDPIVREKFERLLLTWKNGLPGGRPVFPRHVIEPIEKSIAYIQEKQPKNIHVNPNFLNKDQRFQTVVNTRDPRYKNINPALQVNKIDNLSSSTTNLLAQIQSVLPQKTVINRPSAPTVTSSSINQLFDQIQAILPTLPMGQTNSIEQYISKTASISTTSNNNSIVKELSIPQPSAIINNSSNVNPIPIASVKLDTADLLKSLTSMGYLNHIPEEPTILKNVSSLRLDSKDLQIPRPGAIELLYSAEPLQCKQCGFRYPKTEKGQQKMDAHLDIHFRQNRKIKERGKRGLSRSWFVTVNEWIHGEGGESVSQQVPTFLQDGMGHVNKLIDEDNNTNEADVKPDELTVIKHTDERRTCPICGENFIDFWNDDEEEWMYKNAVLEKDKIFHATCYVDAVKSGTKRKIEVEHSSEQVYLKRIIR